MKYIVLIFAVAINLLVHWHYYRWCIFNNRINRPKIYWSYKGDLIVLISTILLFGTILIFFKWYFVFVPIIFFLILKEIAFRKSLDALKKEYIEGKDGRQRMTENKAEEMAKIEIKSYNR